MRDYYRRSLAGFASGDTFVLERTFTQQEVDEFARITGDHNPLHFVPAYAHASGFDGLICQGMLVGAMMSEMGGKMGWLAAGMSFRFRQPVYPGVRVRCELTLVEVKEGGKGKARAVWTDPAGEVLQEADLFVRLPGEKERAILATLVEDRS